MTHYVRDDSSHDEYLSYHGVCVDASFSQMIERYGPSIEDNDDYKIKHCWNFRSVGSDFTHNIAVYDTLRVDDAKEEREWYVLASTYEVACEFANWFRKET